MVLARAFECVLMCPQPPSGAMPVFGKDNQIDPVE